MGTDNILDEGVAISCDFCKELMHSADIFCPHCGFPQNGKLEQKKAYLKKRKVHHDQLKKSKNRVYLVTTLLGFLALGNILPGILIFYSNQHYLIGTISLLLGGVFAFLAWLSLRKTLIAIILGFILYLIPAGIEIILNPSVLTLSMPLFYQMLIILAFIFGIRGALQKHEIEKEFKKHD